MIERRLLCVLAHPDDESIGLGGLLAKYAAAGIGTYLLTATRGECGWPGDAADYPGPTALGVLREAELRSAAAILGVREVELFDYPDGAVDRVDPAAAIARIVAHLRRIRPQVVVTFAPDGLTGHPDHIAVAQLTTAALIGVGDSFDGGPPHRVDKLYYLTTSRHRLAAFHLIVGDTGIVVDGVERRGEGWPDWAITTRVNVADYWRQIWRAVACHQTQLPQLRTLARLPAATHRRLWGTTELVRAFSLVNLGRAVEDDLFAGLRQSGSDDHTANDAGQPRFA